jgi:hypothetical protein
MSACYICGRRLVSGQRVSILLLRDASGADAGRFMLHESCKAEAVAASAVLQSVPEVDMDEVVPDRNRTRRGRHASS